MTDTNELIHRDDPHIDDSEALFRRVKKDVSNCFTTDRISGEVRLGPAAFSLSDGDQELPGDGLSIYLQSLLIEQEVDPSDLVDSWDIHGVAKFHVSTVRQGRVPGGIIASIDADDKLPNRGRSHGLVRTLTPGMPRSEWKELRNKILREAVYSASAAPYEQ